MKRTIMMMALACLAINIPSADDIDAERYSAWKAAFNGGEGTKALLTHNDYIAVQLDNTVDIGRFNIGTWPAGECLTYVYPEDPWSSWVILRVDGASYKAPGGGPSVSSLVPLTGMGAFSVRTWPTDTDSNYIYGGWSVPGHSCIRIYQWLQPIILEYPGYSTGSILIKYIVVNTCSECHDLGVLLQLDTDIAGNDAAELATIRGYTGIEEDFWNCDTVSCAAVKGGTSGQVKNALGIDFQINDDMTIGNKYNNMNPLSA